MQIYGGAFMAPNSEVGAGRASPEIRTQAETHPGAAGTHTQADRQEIEVDNLSHRNIYRCDNNLERGLLKR